MTKVRCIDCGYTWDFSGDDPDQARCSKSKCGRSRNTEVVDDGEQLDEADDTEVEAVDDETDDDPEPDKSTDGGPSKGESKTFTPGFESENVTVDDETTEKLGRGMELDDSTDESSSSTESQESSESDQSDEPEVPDIELDPETLGPAIETSFSMLARRRGEHWELDERPGKEKSEAELLAHAWTPVLNEYAPLFMQQHLLIVSAVGATAMVIAPRVQKDRELAEQAEEDEMSFDTLDDESEVEREEPDPEADAEGEMFELAESFANVA